MMTRSNCSAVGITSSRSSRRRSRRTTVTVAPAGRAVFRRRRSVDSSHRACSSPRRYSSTRLVRRPCRRGRTSACTDVSSTVVAAARGMPPDGRARLRRGPRGGTRRRRRDRRPRRSPRRPRRRAVVLRTPLDGDRHVADAHRLTDRRRRRRVLLAGDAQQLDDAGGEDDAARTRRRAAAGCGCAPGAGYGRGRRRLPWPSRGGDRRDGRIARRRGARRTRAGLGSDAERSRRSGRRARVRARLRRAGSSAAASIDLAGYAGRDVALWFWAPY